MKSPKLLRLEKEAEPERLRLEVQTLKLYEELEILRELSRKALKAVETQTAKEAKYRLPFKEWRSFDLPYISKQGDIRYCDSMYISPWESDSSKLYIMQGSEKLYVLPGLSKDTPAPIAEETATRMLEADGYRFIPCTWLDEYYVHVHWPEDLL